MRGRLVSPRTQRAVQLRTEAAMRSTIQVLRGGLGSLDPVSGTVGGLVDADVVYGGAKGAKARIRTLRSSVVNVGEGTQVVRRAIVSIPIDAPRMPWVDDLVVVVTPGDADLDLASRLFRVTGVEGGGLFGDARRMEVEGWYQSRYWTAGQQ